MKILARLSACLAFASACDATDYNIPQPKDLQPGGVWVSYVLPCSGCEKIGKGDLIQKVDGKPVTTAEQLDAANLTDGRAHELHILADNTLQPKTVVITAQPGNNMPPLKDTPPFWTVSAEKLNAAPTWARRRMFGHASPMAMLVGMEGGILDGRQLFGKKRLIVYWDHGTRDEQAQAVAFMQVLQKAQAQLAQQGVEVMFVHLQFSTNTRQVAMNDSELRRWRDKWGLKNTDGTAYPHLPFYRFPNRVEFNAARQLGMENAYTVFENLGASPAILLQDERGIVRWHSEGIQTPPGGDNTPPEQWTIIEAVKFSLEKL